MRKLIKWRVDPAPTGPWSSFQTRSWPSAEYSDGRPAGGMQCETEYRPSDAKSGDHKPLKIFLIDYSKPNGNCSWTRTVFSKLAATLKEAKERLEEYIKRHPEVMPAEYRDPS
jgi:hypothetical protein